MLHTTTIQYGIVVLKELQEATKILGAEFDLVSVKQISEKHGMSNLFLEQIMRKLKAAGIIRAHRGPGGGYELLRDNVNVLELYKVLEVSKDPASIKKIQGPALLTLMKVNEALASVIV